jgi:hypothetical protein
VLQSIYSRHHLHDDDFIELVCPMFTPGSVSLLRQVYDWTLSDMNVNDINEQKYTLCKKLSEVWPTLSYTLCILTVVVGKQLGTFHRAEAERCTGRK